MSLLELQQLFAGLVPLLISRAISLGFRVTLGEVFRPVETAKLYADKGIGSPTSLHCEKLAIDLQLFRDGRFLVDTKDYEELGLYWESLNPLCRWGGRFKKPDGDHFSVTYKGRE